METDGKISEALQGIAAALRCLGNADAGTSMGAIEAFGVVVKGEVAPALNNIAEGLQAVADAIRSHGHAKSRPKAKK
jgi:hypothetical protein